MLLKQASIIQIWLSHVPWTENRAHFDNGKPVQKHITVPFYMFYDRCFQNYHDLTDVASRWQPGSETLDHFGKRHKLVYNGGIVTFKVLYYSHNTVKLIKIQ